jgi:hypothetical protein
MISCQWKIAGPAVGIAVVLPNLALAQAQTTVTQADQTNRISIAYVLPNNSALRQLASPRGGKPDYTGLDVIIVRDDKIAALYVFLDPSPS